MDHLVSLFGESLISQSKPSIKIRALLNLKRLNLNAFHGLTCFFKFIYLFFFSPSSKTPRTDATKATSLDSRG